LKRTITGRVMSTASAFSRAPAVPLQRLFLQVRVRR